MAVISGSGGGSTYKNSRILSKKRSPGGSIPKPTPKPTSIVKAGNGKNNKPFKPAPTLPEWWRNEYQAYNSPESQAEAAKQVQEVKENKTNPYSWYRNEYQQYNSPESQQRAQAQVEAQKQADASFFARAGNAATRIFGGGGRMPINYPMKHDNPFTGNGYTTVAVPGRGTDDRQPVPISYQAMEEQSAWPIPNVITSAMYPQLSGNGGGGSSWYTGGRRPSGGSSGGSGFSSQYPSWWQAMMGLGNWNIR